MNMHKNMERTMSMELLIQGLLENMDKLHKILSSYEINQIMQLTLGILNIEDIKWRNKQLDQDTLQLLNQVETILKAKLKAIINDIIEEAKTRQ